MAGIVDDPSWWRHAVVYQIYPRAFADSNGDGVGDINGIRSRLAYLTELGVDAIWINPWYPSPMKDAGYDVADFRAIEPIFGTMAEAEALISELHAAGIRLILDIVPNHFSDQHPWFVDALAAGPGSPQRARFIFRDGRGSDGEQPPNDWRSEFGGPAWQRITEADGRPGQWYLHLFAPEQPDVDWTNPEVRADFETTLRFWFDRGVDGFRIDVAHGLSKHPDLLDAEGMPFPLPPSAPDDLDHPHWDRPENHEIFRSWRRVADSYPGSRAFCGELWIGRDHRLVAYLRPDELHTAFNFGFLTAPWQVADLRASIDSTITSHAQVGAPPTWVIGNHDVCRPASRYARDPSLAAVTDRALSHFIDREADYVVGAKRARAAALLSFALPGSAYLYNGEELGLPEVEDLPTAVKQDPITVNSGGLELGRDGCRVPLPWTTEGASFGFSPVGASAPWLPQPADWGGLSVQAQDGRAGSMLELYRAALALRRELPALGEGDLSWVETGAKVLAFTREPGFACWVNFAAEPVALPAGWQVLLATESVSEGRLAPYAAVWLGR